jgi:hypothetical protein
MQADVDQPADAAPERETRAETDEQPERDHRRRVTFDIRVKLMPRESADAVPPSRASVAIRPRV